MTHLGELVRVQSPVVTRYRNRAAQAVFVSGPKENFRIFVPRAPGKDYAKVDNIRIGRYRAW